MSEPSSANLVKDGSSDEEMKNTSDEEIKSETDKK